MLQARHVLATAALAALALTGCAHSPSAAAVVNGVTVPVSEIDKASAALAKESQSTASEMATTTVTNEVVGLIAQKIAADQGIALNDTTRAAALDASLQPLRNNPDLTLLVDRYADALVVVTKLGAEPWVTACQAVPVTINPRYGTWSPELCALSGSGSLSKPAATAAAGS